MLAAQMQKSADKAVAAVSVIIAAARPMAVFGKMLEHQIEQLYRLRDLGFRHWLSAPMLATNAPYHAADRFRLTFPLADLGAAGEVFLTGQSSRIGHRQHRAGEHPGAVYRRR